MPSERSSVANIAHRGASAYAPENTIPSLDLALALGADCLELDVYLTSDRRFVALHDFVLGRPRGDAPWDSTRRVGTMSSRQVRDVDVGSWFNETRPAFARGEFDGLTPPFLEDVFRRYAGKARFFVDIKEPEGNYVLEVELIRLLDGCGIPNDQVIVGSLSERCLRKLRSIEPSLALAQVLPLGSPVAHSRAELERICCYATAVVPPKEIVDEGVVRGAARTGMQVIPYTVNDANEMRALIETGVDGIVTDYPDRLDEVLTARAGRVTAP